MKKYENWLNKHFVFHPGPTSTSFCTGTGQVLTLPSSWILVPPGDAALTRRVKLAGECWVVQEKVRRRTFSRGVYAARETVERIREELAAERAEPGYARKLAAAAQRRERDQVEYVQAFEEAVLGYLGFDPRYGELAGRVARAITEHATPVGSGTVARTERIGLAERAEAATIAWLRHRTTGYDGMAIARVKGKRREVRRMLAERSRRLLERYRRGEEVEGCLLERALRV